MSSYRVDEPKARGQRDGRTFLGSGSGREPALLFRRGLARPLRRPGSGFLLGGLAASSGLAATSDPFAGRLDDLRLFGFRRRNGGLSIIFPGKNLFRNEKRGRAFCLVRENLIGIFDVKNNVEQADMEGRREKKNNGFPDIIRPIVADLRLLADYFSISPPHVIGIPGTAESLQRDRSGGGAVRSPGLYFRFRMISRRA